MVELVSWLSTSYRWNHIHILGFGFFVCVLNSSTLLWAVNVCTFYCHTVNMPYIFKENLFSYGHLGHLHFGAVNRFLWMFLPMSFGGFKFSFLLGLYLGKKMLCHQVFKFRFCSAASLPTRLYLFHEQCMGVPPATSSKTWYLQSF